MRNAKLLILTLVSAVTALGCSVRMNSHPEYASAPQAETADTFAVPYRNAWDSNANDPVVNTPVRPASVGRTGAAEAVKTSPTSVPAQPARRPVTKRVVEERFSLR